MDFRFKAIARIYIDRQTSVSNDARPMLGKVDDIAGPQGSPVVLVDASLDERGSQLAPNSTRSGSRTDPEIL